MELKALRISEKREEQLVSMGIHTVEELLSGTSKGEKTKDAKSFLLEILADGQKSCNEIMDAAKEKGIKKKTLWNAKKGLNIDSVKVGSQWYWML